MPATSHRLTGTGRSVCPRAVAIIIIGSLP
jgi:hypothetical protein